MLSPSGSSFVASQDVAITPGGDFSLSGHVQANQIDRGGFKVEMVFLNRYNGAVGSAVSKGYYQSTGAGIWDNFYIKGVAPTAAAKVRVQLKSESLIGNVGVDALTLVQGEPSGPVATPTAGASPTPTAAAATPTPTTAAATPTTTATATPTLANPTATPSATVSATATATPVPSATGNLLGNPSFRSPLAEDWIISSWAMSSVRIDAAAAYDGDNSGLLQSSEGTTYNVTQDVTVTPGQKYRLSGFLKLPDLRSGSYRTELLFLNRYGGTVGSPVSLSYSRPTLDWQSFSQVVTVPAGAVKVRVQLKSNSMRGVAYVDALELAQTD